MVKTSDYYHPNSGLLAFILGNGDKQVFLLLYKNNITPAIAIVEVL